MNFIHHHFTSLCIGAEVTVFVDKENVLQAIYFQTKEMKDMFQAYPELLFIDATYKLNIYAIIRTYDC